jgi:hypothetical protein
MMVDEQQRRARAPVTLTPAGSELRERALAVPGLVLERLALTLDDVHVLHRTLTGGDGRSQPRRRTDLRNRAAGVVSRDPRRH